MMDFETTLSQDNVKEFIKSWASVYQSGLLQFHGEKREAGDIGFLRPVGSYLFAFVLGYCILMWGMQTVGFSELGLEVAFGALLLFVLSINFSYTFRPGHFRRIAKKKLLPAGTTRILVYQQGISFTPQGQETVTWEWKTISKVIFFGKTLILYNGEYKSFADTKGHVLLINKEALSPDDCETLMHTYLRPLKLENKFKRYNSYSDIVIFLILCIVIALLCLPISFML